MIRKGGVSIILGVYNSNEYLYEQLFSILNQTYSDLKIFISDDCSDVPLKLQNLENHSIITD